MVKVLLARFKLIKYYKAELIIQDEFKTIRQLIHQ